MIESLISYGDLLTDGEHKLLIGRWNERKRYIDGGELNEPVDNAAKRAATLINDVNEKQSSLTTNIISQFKVPANELLANDFAASLVSGKWIIVVNLVLILD